MFNPVAPYRYLLPNMYLSVAVIANPDLLACGSRTWISLDIARFYEEHFQLSAWPACSQKNGNRAHLSGREGSTQFAQGLLDRCDSSTACRMCRLEPKVLSCCCCYRPTPPACSCGGVRQPSFSREALPGVSST